MSIKITILAICLAMITPGMALAKKPQPAPMADCVILMDEYVYTENPFMVKVVRDPSYTGGWRNPTITVQASYEDSTQNPDTEIKPGLFNVTYVNTGFVVPDDAKQGGTATISVLVEEPLKKKNTFRQTSCSTTAGIL